VVLFSSITQFVEQVNRQKRWEKRDTLDTLVRIYTGPTEQVDGFKPNNGAPDAQYNLMTVIRATDKDLGHGRGISEVTVEYQGKLTSGGQYTSVPTISTSWSEGEVSYTQSSTTYPAGAPVTYSYSHRYTGKNVAIAYITNFRPSGQPTNLGLAKGYLGFTNEFDILTAVTYNVGGGSGGYFSDIRCTDVRIQDLADGWFRVTETYQSRIFPSGASGSPIAGKIFYSSKLVDNTLGQGSTDNYYASVDAAAAGQASANAAGQSLPSSPVGSVGADTVTNTGLDPAWTADQQSTGAAATTTPAADTAAGSNDATTAPDWAGPDSSGMGDWTVA
jgi:hypothetical protein